MPKPTFEKPAHIIQTDEALARVVLELMDAPRLAIDTESDGYYRYQPKLCLIQVSAKGEDYIVDPLTIGDLSPLGLLLGNPEIETLVHSGENDLPLLREATGAEIVPPLFDTQIAAQVAGIKGVGLSSLTKHFLGLSLDKKYQLHDWGARPFDAGALQYARADSHYLDTLRGHLWPLVEEKGREAHAQEEFLRILGRPAPTYTFDPDGCLSLKGAKDLRRRELQILRALWVERDRIAREADVAPFRILSNHGLIDLARSKHTPKSPSGLREITRIPARTIQQEGDALLAAMDAGRAPGAPVPSRPVRNREAPDPELIARFDALKAWRQKAAKRLALDPGILASNTLLKSIAKAQPDSEEALAALDDVRQWQIEEFGEEWLSRLAPPSDA